MENLSKEEILEQEIYKMAEECGDKKWERVKRTFFIMCIPIYLIELYFIFKGGISGIGIDEICGLLFAPPVAVGFILFICYGILFYIIDGAMKDEKTIAKKIGELNAIKFNKYNDCNNNKSNSENNQIIPERYLTKGYNEFQIHYIKEALHEYKLTEDDIDYFLSLKDEPKLLMEYHFQLQYEIETYVEKSREKAAKEVFKAHNINI